MENGVNQNEYRTQRLANMEKLRELGYAPFGAAYARTGRLSELKANFEENKPVRAAGRITARREMGKSVFMDLRDGTDRMQVYLKRDELGPAFEAFAYVDLGDHVGVEGELFTTRAEHEEQAGQRPKGGEYARREDQAVQHDLGFVAPGLIHKAENLDAEHRKHAGHDVEDQAAEEGVEKQSRKSQGKFRRGGWRCGSGCGWFQSFVRYWLNFARGRRY